MNKILIIVQVSNIIILLLSTSRLTFVKKKVYFGWVDKSRKIASFDYVGKFDGAWVTKRIDYKSLLIANPTDNNLKESVKEIRILQIISVVCVSIVLAIVVLGIVFELCGEKVMCV